MTLIWEAEWPVVFTAVVLFHRKWLREKSKTPKHYHSKLRRFEKFFRNMRNRNTDKIQSIARIPIAYPAETHIYGVPYLGVCNKRFENPPQARVA